MPDVPFDTARAMAGEALARGATIFQKFTCQHCGSRQTMEQPDTMFEQGECEECGKLTNIVTQGCGFLAEFKL